MKKTIFLTCILVFIIACSTSRTTEKNDHSTNKEQHIRDGSSFENAIIIKEHSESKGVDAEYIWLHENFPGYKLIGQYLLNNNKKPFDKLDIQTADGQNKSIYFDISNFFGKL